MEETVYRRTDGQMHGRTHARRTTDKCDHKSSPCHFDTGELKVATYNHLSFVSTMRKISLLKAVHLMV